MKGWRHEVESVSKAGDISELSKYLIYSHHGNRILVDHSGEVVFTNYEKLKDDFSTWDLALLETYVRFADWRASANPEGQD